MLAEGSAEALFAQMVDHRRLHWWRAVRLLIVLLGDLDASVCV